MWQCEVDEHSGLWRSTAIPLERYISHPPLQNVFKMKIIFSLARDGFKGHWLTNPLKNYPFIQCHCYSKIQDCCLTCFLLHQFLFKKFMGKTVINLVKSVVFVPLHSILHWFIPSVSKQSILQACVAPLRAACPLLVSQRHKLTIDCMWTVAGVCAEIYRLYMGIEGLGDIKIK